MKHFLFIALFTGFGLHATNVNAGQSSNDVPVETAEFIDLQKYVGKWYEVASIPQFFQRKCARNTVAEYAFAEKGRIQVLNSCENSEGERISAEGRAKVVDQETNSKLKVTFVKLGGWIFVPGGNYWILDVDPNYEVALVGDPSREYAWILSRTPSLSKEKMVIAEAFFRAQGYDTCLIQTSAQTEGLSQREPLCEFVRD